MPSIFELTKNQADLLAAIERGELDGEVAADTLEGSQGEIDEKINSYCHVINKLSLQLEAIESEKDRYATLESEKKNEIKRVKQTLIAGLSGIELNKFDTGSFKGHIRKGSKSVNILNADDLPSEFVETVITEKPDKTMIKKKLEAGEKVSGAEIVTGDPALIIK